MLDRNASFANLHWNWIKLSLTLKFNTGKLHLHSLMLGHRGVIVVDIGESFKWVLLSGRVLSTTRIILIFQKHVDIVFFFCLQVLNRVMCSVSIVVVFFLRDAR